MRPLVNHWTPFTHACHCLTTSRSAAPTQTTARVSPAMQTKVCLHWMPFLPQPSIIPGQGTCSEYADLHTLLISTFFFLHRQLFSTYIHTNICTYTCRNTLLKTQNQMDTKKSQGSYPVFSTAFFCDCCCPALSTSLPPDFVQCYTLH